jgi:hypothetical protein
VLLIDSTDIDFSTDARSGSGGSGDSSLSSDTSSGSDWLQEWAVRLTTQSNALGVLRDWGFGVQDYFTLASCTGADSKSVAETVSRLTAFHDELNTRGERAAPVGVDGSGSAASRINGAPLLPYGIDGVVYKVDHWLLLLY